MHRVIITYDRIVGKRLFFWPQMDIDFSTKQPQTKWPWRASAGLWATFVGVLFFILYAVTAAPSIVELYDDSLEFQLIGPTLGIAHPTGYPLYTVLGALWSRILFPVGNWAWRMNLLSALAAAITVGLLFLITQRLIAQVSLQESAWFTLRRR